MPAAVPAVWAEAGGRRDLESVRSKRLAVCNIQPRQHCSLAGNLGVLLDPLRWPLELWGSRGWVSGPGGRHTWSHPCGPPAHPASCNTLPRPSCSPAAGVLQAAGAAGLWASVGRGRFCVMEEPPPPAGGRPAELRQCLAYRTGFLIRSKNDVGYPCSVS